MFRCSWHCWKTDNTKLRDIGFPVLALQQGSKKLTKTSVLLSVLNKISKELLFILQNSGFSMIEETYHRGSGRCRPTLLFLCYSEAQYLESCFIKSNNVGRFSGFLQPYHKETDRLMPTPWFSCKLGTIYLRTCSLKNDFWVLVFLQRNITEKSLF